MKLRTTRFAAVGRCIYCGSDGGQDGLSEEHIIPLSLGGVAVLPEASCASCRDKTSEVERHCARDMFGVLRIKGGYPTRRPAQRPTKLPIVFRLDGQEAAIDVPIDQYPDILVMPHFPQPGMLRGAALSTSWEGGVIIAQTQKPTRMVGADEAVVSSYLNPWTFTRFLAKIAHGLAVLRYGVDGFRPLLIDHILAGDRHAPHLIGGHTQSYLPDEGTEHDLAMYTLTSDQGDRMIVAQIRLFAYRKTPTYTVVTGIALCEPQGHRASD